MNYKIGFLAAVMGFAIGPAHAHGGHAGDHADGATKLTGGEAKLFGRPGDPKRVARIVNVIMNDAACRTPGELSLRQGETVSFVIGNEGRLEQEVMIGMMSDLIEHAKSTQNDDDMSHDEPHMAHVDPGGGARVVWHFTRVGIYYYGCHAPGLSEPGVRQRILVLR